MSTKESSVNSWENIGICYIFALDKIEQKYRDSWMAIVRYSFGFGSPSTNRKKHEWWCEVLKISKPTFIKHSKWLEENKFIKIHHHNGFIEGGGSAPYSYSPIFPKGYGQMKLKNNSASRSTITSELLSKQAEHRSPEENKKNKQIEGW